MAQHPNFLHLAGLVCEAVLEVVFVALPGFVVASNGMFDASSQKFVAELNMMVFTPCLIFTKLASQLTAEKLGDLIIIPLIFIAQTFISWVCALAMVRVFGFGGAEKKRQRNFILAMGVFGNSNSLPISLVMSLSKTISGLHWDKIPGDDDDEVAARGILYLLIFQQLGQLLRWTWGFSVLLKPAAAYETAAIDEVEAAIEEYRDEPDDLEDGLVKSYPDSAFSSGAHSPITPRVSSDADEQPLTSPQHPTLDRARSTGHITTFPNYSSNVPHPSRVTPKTAVRRLFHPVANTMTTFWKNQFRRLPPSLQAPLRKFQYHNAAFWKGVWRQLNPPLWAMIAALFVASIPALQRLFFTPGTLVNNSFTRAVTQTGGVAVPLILVVLGANLARSTLPKEQLAISAEEKAEEQRLLWASLLARMVLPTILMAPLLALVAKFVPISILDDPIFIIVCFLLTGAPSALQLAQICQVNGVFMGVMSRLLTASYVVAILPSTLVLVLLALEVLQWAQ
ncbi:auxin efflux carrier [Piedraia hortae CBS 480.64]|uniref:Auxin efflux carrier n=1 Tax=Piedraia hortae CBS 480.64 TaxID=1314780 RepID=A0A6A7C0J1_9PEZI|nr:auxin efflux carrier [Piedraia hortae CBS 480.64]